MKPGNVLYKVYTVFGDACLDDSPDYGDSYLVVKNSKLEGIGVVNLTTSEYTSVGTSSEDLEKYCTYNQLVLVFDELEDVYL